MAVPDDESSAVRPAPTQRLLALMAVILAVVPVVYHGVRAAAGRWVPTGDDAYFTLRSLDVATANHPLLGAWSSGSVEIERQVNNLGPMQLDLLAPFTKVAWAGGTALGVVTVHVGAILAIAWLSQRLGGHRQVVASMLGVAVLAWVMGSEMLLQSRQHPFLLLPYLCLLVATWAAAAGDRWAPLVWVVAASLVAQTHLSYPILVAGLAVPMLVGQGLAWREHPAQRRASVRSWAVAAAVGFVLWMQTLVDQVFGWGNFTAAFASSGESDAPGLITGARVVAGVLVAPAGYLRPGFATFAPYTSIGTDAQVVLLVLGWSALVAATVVAHRRGHRIATAGIATVTVAIAAGVLNAARLPNTTFGLAASNYRWLWPTAAFVLLGLASLAVRVWTRATAGVLAIVGVLAIATLPRAYEMPRADVYLEGQVGVAAITDQLFDELPRRDVAGPVVIDHEAMEFWNPFSYPLAIVLQELDLEYRFEGARYGRRFGESRVADGSEPSRLVLHQGDEAVERSGDPDTVAFVDGATPVSVTLERGSEP